ncbi:pre-mRNA-splicing factor CWC22 homolog [Venturia canescens]|uniref:pre-mRNA-splicing factor CWC22 homolog n=1 Tax=Venturia canescens TaxID=32260 RepID=UPI001C9D6556|nr:pre-mRNA-splicing factor CWC22 homolog [Venturia canescens]
MVRTKAGSVSNKAIGAKAPQKVAITAILSGNAPKSKHTGGNPYHPRETPGWQKPITFFMKQDGENSRDESIEIENLPGLPGIKGDPVTPKTLGTKKKSKDKKSKGRSDVEEEKKVKNKNKKKDRSDDEDVEKKSKKKVKEQENPSDMDVDNETECANESVDRKELNCTLEEESKIQDSSEEKNSREAEKTEKKDEIV